MRYLQPGDLVARGDAATAIGFRILERLHPPDPAPGVDPRSAVYLARDEAGGLGQVVLKFPNWEPTEEEAHVERLRAATRRLTRLAHPNVARVHDLCFDAEGRLFFVLEYVDGTPLRSLTGPLHAHEDESFGTMSVAEFMPLASQLAEALAGAHRQGLLWCDIKPGNALVTRDASGRKLLKLIDPGEVRAIDRPNDLTGSTPENVAPERRGVGPTSLSGTQTDPAAGGRSPASRRTEVYELGLVFYEMLTGKHGYEAGAALRDRHERPDVPRELRNLVRTMLELDPKRRCPSVAEVVRRLKALEAASSDRTVTLDAPQLTETIRLDDTLGPQAVRALVDGDYDRLIFLHYARPVLEVAVLDLDEIAVPRATSYTLDLRTGHLTRECEPRPLEALIGQLDPRLRNAAAQQAATGQQTSRLDAQSLIGKALLQGIGDLYGDEQLWGREGIGFVLLDLPGDPDEDRTMLYALGDVLEREYYPPLRHDKPQRPQRGGPPRLSDAIDKLLRTAPLRYPYVLAVATSSGSGYSVSSLKVFEEDRPASSAPYRPTARPPRVVSLRSSSSADQHVLLALFARVDDRPLVEQPLVQASWAYLRGGETYSLGLTLERAGRVGLACVDADESFLVTLPTAEDGWEGDPPASEWLRVPDDRDEAERHVRDQIARVDSIEDEWQRKLPRPVQICLILDSIGDQTTMDERRRIAADFLQELKRLPERARFRIALVAYGDHRHVERVTYDEPDVYLEHDFGTIDQAISKLAQLRPLEGQDFEGCFEDALRRASLLGWRREAARALVAIVNRPPHPAEVEYRRDEEGHAVVYDQIACPERIDWEAELDALDGAGIGELFSFVLLCPQHWKLLRWAWLDPRNPDAARLVFDPDQPVEKDPPPHAAAYRRAFAEGLARTRLIELQPDSTGHLHLPADFVEMVGRVVAAPPLPALADR